MTERLYPAHASAPLEALEVTPPEEWDEGISAMSDAELTLWLARRGVSPADTQASLDRLMAQLDEMKVRL